MKANEETIVGSDRNSINLGKIYLHLNLLVILVMNANDDDVDGE